VKGIYLLFLFVTLTLCCCTEQDKKSPDTIPVELSEAKGFVISPDSLRPPVVIAVSVPKKIKAGQPKIIPIKLNQGEAGGISLMQNYTTDNGLALDAISYGHKSALCDKQGNLWFGTEGGGLSRYDGKSFTNYTSVQGLANSKVLSIIEDKNGNIWVGTDGGGVSRYDGTHFTNYQAPQGPATNNVRSITEDRHGDIWFGTNGGGVTRYDGKQFVTYTISQGLAGNIVNSIAQDKYGDIWFGTEGGGVSRYNGSSFVNYTTIQGLASNDILCITEDKNGNIWFGTNGAGVSCFSGKMFSNYTTAEGLANNVVNSITEDKKGNIWFGTNGDGVSRYDGISFTNYTTAQGLANNVVNSITEDKSGNIWFGTYGGGLSRYDGKAFTNYTTVQGLANNMVRSIMEDRNKNIWVGTEGGGVSCYTDKSFSNYTAAQGLANNQVYSMAEDRKGNIWFGTNGAGVSCFDGTYFINYSTAQGLTNNNVRSIKEDSKGNLWFGTNGAGVSCFNGKTFTNYTRAQGLPNNNVRSIAEDKNGNIWFGTNGGGLSCFNGKTFTNYNMAQGLANNNVRCITEDMYGNMWIGTFGGGVSRYDGTSFRNYTTADGLPDNTVTQVVIDKQQRILIGTNFGIAVWSHCLQLSELKPGEVGEVGAVNALKNNELKDYKPVFEIYNSETGYPVKDVNSGQNAMYKDSHGIIWIGTGADKTSLVRFDYAALNKNTHTPIVTIQSIKVNEEKICWYSLKSNQNDSITVAQQEAITFGKLLTQQQRDSIQTKFRKIQFNGITKFYPLPQNLVLPYKNNHISFEYAAIEPVRPYLVKYQYFLEGYDHEWSPLTSKTDVSYGNIYEGTYIFKLKAQSPFGIWSEPVSYTFVVLPPWWRTWWMYISYGIGIIALIVLIVFWNGRRLSIRAKELAERVRKATIEISKQKTVLEEKHKEITDSINYAERIQRALLASKELLDENLNQYFVFFKPKDIVSGDFYWATELNNCNFALVTADSTGHGVPGAIMSILNMACLKEAVIQGITSPDLILNETRRLIIENLKNDGSAEGGKDGMDGSLLSFDFKNKIMYVACANSVVWIIRGTELIELKPDRMPVGKHEKDTIPFTLHTVNLKAGDVVYTLTDGLPDQFGGNKGKKFMYKHLKELLLSVSNEPMEIQKQKLSDAFAGWKGNLEQVDDVCLLGVRI
jgi:ligand-binding sensor domain-containing protein/serine phosphatase RsbU (regulator of sigma subunit)